MAPQTGKPFLNEAEYQSAQNRVAMLRQQLMDDTAPFLIGNPQLADVLNARVNAILDAVDAEARSGPSPADHGLAGLIGLGSEASTEIGTARIAPAVVAYDDDLAQRERGNAIADCYYLYQHEVLGVFRVVLKLQELFKAGVVRLSDGPGAYRLYQFDRKQVLRFSPHERAQAYQRAFGYRLPGYSQAGLAPYASRNTDFHPLFNTFIAEVARFFRDKRISEVVRERANDPSFGSIAIVRRAGLDLRYNLKNFSYGHLSVLRIELMQLLEEAFQILNSPDVRGLFGAASAWDVIEDVLRRYFKEHVNVSPRNRMATAGRSILRWLAQQHITTTTRAQFEALAQDIAEPAEEWLASAHTVGVALQLPDTPRGSVSMPTRIVA
ncbi:hypothetical protein [Microvirga arabica]|uniref:hypothetical protein n=1 Tax=Microvirga arabica TaxID=1128671 RepID=UPI00193A2D16|nr:hypothetical protein [Microvirga arabica]MBM1174031.1 hypothetical protein [Microvirga arabica]